MLVYIVFLLLLQSELVNIKTWVNRVADSKLIALSQNEFMIWEKGGSTFIKFNHTIKKKQTFSIGGHIADLAQSKDGSLHVLQANESLISTYNRQLIKVRDIYIPYQKSLFVKLYAYGENFMLISESGSLLIYNYQLNALREIQHTGFHSDERIQWKETKNGLFVLGETRSVQLDLNGHFIQKRSREDGLILAYPMFYDKLKKYAYSDLLSIETSGTSLFILKEDGNVTYFPLP